jgi:hypothetical protein
MIQNMSSDKLLQRKQYRFDGVNISGAKIFQVERNPFICNQLHSDDIKNLTYKALYDKLTQLTGYFISFLEQYAMLIHCYILKKGFYCKDSNLILIIHSNEEGSITYEYIHKVGADEYCFRINFKKLTNCLKITNNVDSEAILKLPFKELFKIDLNDIWTSKVDKLGSSYFDNFLKGITDKLSPAFLVENDSSVDSIDNQVYEEDYDCY